MKLLQELKKKPFCNDFHLILIPILLLIISLKYYFFIIFLLIYLIFLMKRTKLLFPISSILQKSRLQTSLLTVHAIFLQKQTVNSAKLHLILQFLYLKKNLATSLQNGLLQLKIKPVRL